MDISSINTDKNALERSLKMLDNFYQEDQFKLRSLSSKSRKRGPFDKSRMDAVVQSTQISSPDSPSTSHLFDSEMSITMFPGELKSLMKQKGDQNKKGTRFVPDKCAQDKLFGDFLEVWQRSNSTLSDVFNSILEYMQCCTEALDLMCGAGEEKRHVEDKRVSEIESELITWKLVYSLYQNRILSVVGDEEEMEEELNLEISSEKEIMEKLYKKESTVREWQLILDWLEGNAADLATGPGLEGFTDKGVAWENTLHELQNKRPVPYPSTREFITELDPDAPRRQNKHLHDMDQEDDDRLVNQVLLEIRCGRLERAQEICDHAGQPWRAAILEGWKLYHDPNYSLPSNPVYRETQPVEGNPNRDIWKVCAWRMCEDGKMAPKERAAIAAYCGHLPSLLNVSNTWEDILWSYLKTLVDIRVEKEIRLSSYKNFVEMPAAYWNNEMNLEAVFNEMAANKDGNIRKEAISPDHVVQKHIITDNIAHLMDEASKWLTGCDMSVGQDSESISPHLLRFLTHLVLFLRQIGRSPADAVGDSIIEAYVKLLVERREINLVAWYTKQLPEDDQVYYYSAFLEEINDAEERKATLQAASDAGLNVELITKTVVENVRLQACNVENVGLELQDVSPEDWAKISALDWLNFYPTQRTELLIQANALVAYFLASSNVLAARMAFNKVPDGTIGMIQPAEQEIYMNDEMNSGARSVAQATKEYLCYKSYLDADESFADWFQHFHHAKPEEPVLPANYTFIEKVFFEHKHNQYKIDLERWDLAMQNQTMSTKALLFNVLTFPMGWLVDEIEADEADRVAQLNALRSLIIPKVAFLLHLIMHSMADYAGCVALGDLIAARQDSLHKVFTKQRLQDLLQKIAESSLALINEGKDPWGFAPV